MLEKILLTIIIILLLYFIYLHSNKINYKKNKKMIKNEELSDSVLEIIDDIFDEYNSIRLSKEI